MPWTAIHQSDQLKSAISKDPHRTGPLRVPTGTCVVSLRPRPRDERGTFAGRFDGDHRDASDAYCRVSGRLRNYLQDAPAVDLDEALISRVSMPGADSPMEARRFAIERYSARLGNPKVDALSRVPMFANSTRTELEFLPRAPTRLT